MLQIQERYRALKVIGQGGFGKTFLEARQKLMSHKIRAYYSRL